MNIPEETIAAAARDYIIYAFKEGTTQEIGQAKIRFNDFVSEAYRTLSKSVLMAGFHRPTAGEFRVEFIDQCRQYARRKGMF